MRRSGTWTIALALLLTTAGLSGCIGSDDASLDEADTSDTAADPVDATDAGNTTDANATDLAEEADANASAPTFPDGTVAPEAIELRDCYEHYGSFPVPASDYEDELPDGFSLFPFAGEPTGASAVLFVLGQACDLPTGETVTRVITSLAVQPPDALAHPETDVPHDLVLSWVTTHDQNARINEAWGFGDVVQTGEVTMDTTETPAAREGTLEASAGDATIQLDTTVGGQTGSDSADQLRLFALGDDGTVTGAKDLSWTTGPLLSGNGVASGSQAAGMPSSTPIETGSGVHVWDWDGNETYVDLPPRED